jgi:predicted nucleic acid-binding Zn ribbon protein
MKCSECQSENREGVKFCEDCGAKMEVKCPSCGAFIAMDKRFCGECGHNLRKHKWNNYHFHNLKWGVETIKR